MEKRQTKQQIQEAMAEVRQAIQPNRRQKRAGKGVKEGVGWLAAVGVGAAVLWNGLKQSRKIGDVPPLPLTAGKPAPPDITLDRIAGVYEQPVELPAPPQGVVAIAKDLIQRFTMMEGATRGAALAFAGVFSLIPLLLFGLAILGHFITPERAVEAVQEYVGKLLPGKQAATAASAVLKEANIVGAVRGLQNLSAVSSWLGLGGVAFAVTSLFAAAADPMNKAWNVVETRNFIKLRLVGLGVFFGAGVLFLLSLLPSAGPEAIRHLHIPWLNLPQPVPGWLNFLISLIALPINMGMFVLIYKYLPNAKVSWYSALRAGVIIGVLWEAFKKGFSIYLSHFANYNKLYGTFGGIALLVTWIYYSCIVMLLGAAICKMIEERKEWQDAQKPAAASPTSPITR